MHLWNNLHVTRNPGNFGIHFNCATHRSVSSSKLHDLFL